MSDNASKAEVVRPASITEIIDEVEPMGDLRRFTIDDLTSDDEDDFFRFLEEA